MTTPTDRKPTDTDPSELDALAQDIYVQRVAGRLGLPATEREALDSYRAAEALLAARQRVKTGALKIKPSEGPELADCAAPNLPPTNPYNLISQRFGDLKKVERVHAWLEKNPTPEKNVPEFLERLNKEFAGFNWELSQVNTARVIFPNYVPG